MIIAKAVVKSIEFGREKIAICTEKEEERLSEDYAIILYNSPLAKGIMRAAVKVQAEPKLKRNKRFTVSVVSNSKKEEVIYSLKSYEYVPAESIYNEFRRIISLKQEVFCEDTTLHLYNGICSCKDCYNRYGFDRFDCYEDFFYSNDNRAKVSMQVLKCKTCGEYYVRADDYRKAVARAGSLNVKTDFAKGEYYRTDDELCEVEKKYVNILTNMGYYSFLATSERRTIIEKAVKEYGKETVCELLKEYIDDHSVYRPKSNYIWNRDISYINKIKEHAE